MQRHQITKIAIGGLLALSVTHQTCIGHGYISSPDSRTYLCKQGININCGPIQWEPQSAEGPDRFPETGPADGTIAAAGLPQFSQLNEQTASRWQQLPMQSGTQEFSWHFTANHASRDWRYYITKPGWDVNQPLTRASFDLNPFCSVDGDNQRPPVDTTHTCNVPERSGYHIILGVWDVADTVNSFYQVIDVVFDGGNPPQEWSDIGDINPSLDLSIGDQVKTRVFDANGELPSLQTVLSIDTTANGEKNVWPFLLAQKVNQEQTQLKAGIKDADNNITPAYGKNDVFAEPTSNLVRVEIEIDQQSVEPEFSVSNLNTAYPINNSQATVDFDVNTSESLTVEATVFSPQNQQVGYASEQVNGSHSFAVAIQNAEPGNHTLVITARDDASWMDQQTYSFELTAETGGEYEYVYPDNIANYKEGTSVLASDGKIYQCKPYPFNGWCTIYSSNSNQYEPGVGSNWQDAWLLISQ